MNVYRYVWNNPVKWTDPSGLSPGIEYACLASFGAGSGATVGGTGALGVTGIFKTVAVALAQATGRGDQVGQIEADVARAEAAITATVASIEAATLLCGVAKAKKVEPKVCPIGGPPTKLNSFGAGTLVLSREGLKPIEDIRVGELVATVDPETGMQRWRPVKARSMRLAPQVMRLTLKDEAGRIETVVATPNHPYLRAANDNGGILNAVRHDPGGDWTAAGFLREGDQVPSAKGGLLTVVANEMSALNTNVRLVGQ